MANNPSTATVVLLIRTIMVIPGAKATGNAEGADRGKRDRARAPA